MATTHTRQARPKLTRAQVRLIHSGAYPTTLLPPGLIPKPLWWRAVRRTARVTWKLQKRAWTWRRHVAPAYVSVLVFIVGAIAHIVQNGNRSIVALAALFALAVAGREVIARVRPRGLPQLRPTRRGEWAYTVGIATLVTAWLYWAAVDGVMPPRPAWLVVILGIAWPPVVWRYWIRDEKPAEPAELPEVAQRWLQYAASPRGIAPGSVMHDIQPLDPKDKDLGTRIRLELPPDGSVSANVLVGQTERIAMILQRPFTLVGVEPLPHISPCWADLAILNRDTLLEVVKWAGPEATFDPETGIVLFSRYATGGMAEYRMFRKSGPVHDLVAGTTDAGKSEGLNMLLAIERSHPYMASVIIDPQQGQSLPAWINNVAVYARSVTEGEKVMLAVTQELYRRNRILGDLGINAYDINSPVIRGLDMPMICVTIEEGGDALQNAIILQCAIKAATMGRKCGIKIRIVVQLPQLDQLVSTVLRDMIAGGNVIVYRTANRMSGPIAFNGTLPADPHDIPREFHDRSTTAGLCYVLGPGAKATMTRTSLVDDLAHWSTIGETTKLPAVEKFLAQLVVDSDDYETADDSVPEVIAAAVAQAATARSLPDRIVAYFADNPGYVTTSVLRAHLGDPPKSSVSDACAKLVKRKLIVKHVRGLWGSLETKGFAPADGEGIGEVAA